jgi:septum formation topological specificity factor MinE
MFSLFKLFTRPKAPKDVAKERLKLNNFHNQLVCITS